MSPIEVSTAEPEEIRPALHLMFQHLPAGERHGCVARTLQMLDRGELQREEILIVRDGSELRGMLVCCGDRGGGQIFPPQVVEGLDRSAVEDALLAEGIARLREKGARFAQCVLLGPDTQLAGPLPRHGFSRPANLLILSYSLAKSLPWHTSDTVSAELSYRPYGPATEEVFADTLLRTFEGTKDFPELDGLRTLEEILEGHKNHGVFHPSQWFLAYHSGQPIGVVILAELPPWREWELSYFGLIPQARGQGLGRLLLRKALVEAAEVSAEQLTVAVDCRNAPALALYLSEGFEQVDEREVWMLVL